jgi:AbiJ N-terminal domain 4
MKFSERSGYKPVKEQLQIDSIDTDLKNSLWSIYLETFLKQLQNWSHEPHLARFCRALWFQFFKLPLDTLKIYSDNTVHAEGIFQYLREYFFNTARQWYDIYDLLEFSTQFASKDFISSTNSVLEREKSAYRFVNGQIVQITSETEISEMEEAISSTDKYKPVNTHLNSSLKFLADKQSPDYRNSIKESISAIESMCKIFTKNDKATLGDTLNQLEKSGHLHPALKKAFSALYGYTSDEGGIRHALIEESRVIDFHEAKFMLVTCSSFINFLLSRQT